MPECTTIPVFLCFFFYGFDCDKIEIFERTVYKMNLLTIRWVVYIKNHKFINSISNRIPLKTVIIIVNLDEILWHNFSI